MALNQRILTVKSGLTWLKLNDPDLILSVQAITQSLIQSEVQAHYHSKKETTKPILSSFPKIKIRTGQKFIVEDTNTPDGKVSIAGHLLS